MLADRGQAVLDGAVQVSADSRRRATCAGVDGVSTGLLGGDCWPTRPARAARGGPVRESAACARWVSTCARSSRAVPKPGPRVISQRLRRGQKAGRAAASMSRSGVSIPVSWTLPIDHWPGVPPRACPPGPHRSPARARCQTTRPRLGRRQYRRLFARARQDSGRSP